MSYLDHVRRCNLHDLSGFRRFEVAGQAVGWVRHGLAEMLAGCGPLFRVEDQAVALVDPPGRAATADSRSRAFAEVASDLVGRSVLRRPRNESFPVMARWGAAPVMHMDRGFTTSFGVLAFGVQVTGYVRTAAGGFDLWIGRRAKDRGVEPGKLDSLVGGGLPSHTSLAENLVKEGAEEAGLTAALALSAQPVGIISYTMERLRGLKRDILFLYDLCLPESFEPRNADGEVQRFERMGLDAVAALVRDTNVFKFNINLVIIDFMVRHGVLPPDSPDYVELVRGLRQ